MKKAARQTVNDALSDVHVANVLLYWYSACPGKKKNPAQSISSIST